ncbi:nuclease-related domain-containing protein [Halobacillus ihumii]|uniref:nuclease-related domain-containing protein n=1 Tax=Halobacillus ihumii TaxID=2686092 RepID=UPI0013CFBFFD|nr:nuclease-related domain-containing protein [Halobacillus ihumii]
MITSFLEKYFKKKPEVSNPKLKQPGKKKTSIAASRIGELGEYKIEIQLDQLPKEWKHLHDLLLPNQQARSGYSQIDHTVITPYGIFVIETKNYNGTIYGGKDRKTWSVNGKFRMMNPFIQNYGHIEAIKPYIPSLYYDHIVSIVSFTKRCTFKAGTELRKITSNQLLVYDVELSEFITRKVNVTKLQTNQALLTLEEIRDIYEALQAANITDTTVRQRHIKKLQQPTHNNRQTCVVCERKVSKKVSDFCLENKQFKGKVYCLTHQKKSVNK